MEEIKIKNKTWTILETIKENRSYKVQRKKKVGILKKFMRSPVRNCPSGSLL